MISGETFIQTGYYKYNGHADYKQHDCFVPNQSNNMLFQKGEKVPKLGSCDHDIEWLFSKEYK